MPSSLPIHVLGAEYFEALCRVTEYAFARPPDPAETLAAERALLEFDRTIAAVDGQEIVGCGTTYSLRLTVPGGRAVPTAGVSWVAVLPTHRRRGILRSLMRYQFDEIRERGREPIAALWASEAGIYGRFGYGLATASLRLSMPRGRGSLREVPGADSLRTRLVDPAESLGLVAPVYDLAARRRPGMPVQASEGWRRYRVLDPQARRDGASPLRTVLVSDDTGALRAYARYSTTPRWEHIGPSATATVREIEWVDPAGHAAAWRYLLGLDLVATVDAPNRPVDDPLLHLLLDPRAAEPALCDALYVRIVDLPAAMRARRYAAPVDLVLEVADEWCPWNAGRWRLQAPGGDAEADCERSENAPDLELDVRELGACYLGGTSLRALADAGLVTEPTAGSVAALSQALRHEPAPWCPYVF